MDTAAFSSDLFDVLSRDLGFRTASDELRFDPKSIIDPFRTDLGYIRRAAFLTSCLKKTEVESDPYAESRALLSFLQANYTCKAWSLGVGHDPAIGFALEYARVMLRDWFEPQCGTQLVVNMASIEQAARFGPGVSLGMGRRPTQLYFKLGDSPMTAGTDFVRSWYEVSVRHNPLCEAAEMARKARHGPIDLTPVGSLSLQPKSYLTRRVCVTEPTCNTFFQLGLGEVMHRVLKQHTGIDFTVQPARNSMLAKWGSEYGIYATMDLKQCSDYIATGMVAYMFPRSVVQWVNALRTSDVNLKPYGLGDMNLGMVSTMGNGYTFALQTALLTAVLFGVYKTLDIPIERPCGADLGNFGVFGDDIVVDHEAFNLMAKCCEVLGLVVNRDKSFASGPFRESCGSDYFQGQNVRGVYFKRYPRRNDLYSIFNRSAIWSARFGIPLPNTLRFVHSCLAQKAMQWVPPDEGITSGLVSPYPPEGIPFKEGNWHYASDIPIVSKLRVEPWEVIAGTSNVYYDERGIERWLRSLTLVTGYESLNEPAMLKTLLYGALRRGTLSTRISDSVHYRTVARQSPRWGWSSEPLLANLSTEERDRWDRSLIPFQQIG